MFMSKKYFLWPTIIIGLFFGSHASLYAVQANRLVYGEVGRLDTFDPYTTHEASGKRLADLLFDSLIDLGPGGEYVPGLASSWTISKDRTSVTFSLKPNVYWHAKDNNNAKSPKTAFSVRDVEDTVKLLLAKGSEIPNKERFLVIKSVEATGEGQATIHLRRALVDPLRVMMFKILPSHVLGSLKALKRDSDFASHPIGTGPYTFVKANAQGEVLLAANNNYFGGRPQIESIIVKHYADQNIMSQSLMFNSLDLVTYVSPRDLGEVMGDAKLSVVPYDALSFSFFAMNTSRGILRDKRVRQGICYAINRQEMLKAFFQGKGRLISGPFPPTSWAYNLDVKGIGYDSAKAKALFQAAGLKDTNKDSFLEDAAGNTVTLQFAVPLAGESEMIKRMVLAFQNYLTKAGLKVELQFMDWLVWKRKVLGQHEYDVTLGSWSFDDASNIYSLFHSSSAVPWGNNFVLYRNPEVDSLLSEAQATNDFDKHRAIYRKLHAILADEVPYAYLWTLMHHAAHNVRLTGVKIEPFAFFKYVLSWHLDAPSSSEDIQ